MSIDRLAEIVDARGMQLVEGVRDVDEFVEIATRVTRPHTIIPHHASAELAAQMRAVDLDGIAVSHLTYGADLSVVPGEDEPDSFIFPLTIAGTAHLRYGSDRLPATGNDATVIAPYREFRSDIAADYDQLLLTVPRARLEQVAASLAWSEPERILDIPLSTFDLPASVTRILEALALLEDATGPLADPGFRRRLQDAALEALLLSIPAFQQLLPAPGGIRSSRVRAAMSYMLDHLSEPCSLAEVARSVGVSPRGLQLAFRKEVDQTPTAWLRAQRLERARRLLASSADEATTVTAVANACGFFHTGEFAAQFRVRFGTTPSELLRASRRRDSLRHSATDASLLR